MELCGGVDPLTDYALRGLQHCWMPDLGRWSHKYHLDGRSAPNESVPHSDVYYSFNVLVGVGKVPPAANKLHGDTDGIFSDLCKAALNLPVRPGAWGMALWASDSLGVEAQGLICDRLIALGRNVDQAIAWQAQDVGLCLTGACLQARHDRAWLPLTKGPSATC